MNRTAAAPVGDPLEYTFRDLHRQHRLAAEYPRIPGLLRDLPPPELVDAGRVLSRLSVDEVVELHPRTPVVSVAVTGHGTVTGVTPSLTAELARHGLLLRPHITDFDAYVFELSDPNSALYAARPDLVACLLDHTVVFDEVPVPWGPEHVESALAATERRLTALADTFEAVGHGTLVYNTLPLPREYVAQLVDHRSRARLGALWREANARVLRLMEDHPRLIVLDLEPLIGSGLPGRDVRLSTYTGTHLSPELTAGYTRELAHLARGLSGRARKCLVLDLDNTVWGGVLGDDGPEGIEVAGSYRGEAFRAVQRTALQLSAQGVLLAAVSKNDLEPVREVLREHPEMTLGEEDFVRIVADWAPKHDNLRSLAADLNIGLDSLVFADDSPYECGLVARELPEVAVVRLDGDPATHVQRLLADGWFDVREVTVEDVARPARYREESQRKDFLDSFASIDDYLAGLGIEVEFAEVTPTQVARVAQLTLRTNQFNLTTERLGQSDVEERAAAARTLVLGIRSGDRFGDNGLVGAVFVDRFVDRDESVWRIENFLLSCRVFSRGIESACLGALLEHARAEGARQVLATYRPSAKNDKVRDFYPRNGFETESVDDDGTIRFRHDLIHVPERPRHLRLSGSIGRTQL
ncbi:HAD-IIIC family phosphatase [Embleya sp. NPDC055664]|uniref:HAD-IIIC family phosphatase n=1 Tax=Embleya sp. NPDC059237 TaxID=3346784 RepID=UPI0036CE17DD